MNARKIQALLFSEFGNKSALMVPNYTPAGWFECDMWRVTKAGYGEEFEIKLSVADFRKDSLKGPDEHMKKWILTYPEGSKTRQSFDPRTKHERLAAGAPPCPCRFWFVMPDEVAAKVEIPHWAGLIHVREHRGRVHLHKHQPAPQLHRAAVDQKITDHARSVFYWRYWKLRNGQPEESVTT
jgi:hypothetical protein